GAISEATFFSLYATKNVAAGEGGLFTTNSDALARAVDDHRIMRRGSGSRYDTAVAELDGIEPLARDPRDTHALHLYVVRIDPERAGATRDEYQRALAEE